MALCGLETWYEIDFIQVVDPNRKSARPGASACVVMSSLERGGDMSALAERGKVANLTNVRSSLAVEGYTLLQTPPLY